MKRDEPVGIEVLAQPEEAAAAEFVCRVEQRASRPVMRGVLLMPKPEFFTMFVSVDFYTICL